MRVIAFAGPSLPLAERVHYAGVEWHPPAEAGDLLRLARQPPDAICLIDGYFDQRPAVRHKEILLLLSLGVRIYGASSIGALRAAEMDRFGMIGVGAIYQAYRDGLIEGDDEVALVHAPAALGWQPLSLPLIEVRATLDAGVAAGILTPRQRRRLMTAASAIFYQDRDWPAIAELSSWPAPCAWLRDHHIAQKTIDARACLIEACANREPGANHVPAAVMPGFVAALARDCGLADPALPQAQRATAPKSPHAVQRPEKDAGT